MIKTVFVTVTYKMDQYQAFNLKAQGKEGEYRAHMTAERERDESELDQLLSEGFKVLHAGTIEVRTGQAFVYMLHKPDPLWTRLTRKVSAWKGKRLLSKTAI